MQRQTKQQILGYYIEDARGHLKVIERHLLNLQGTIEDPEKLSELYRAARCGIVGGANLLPISSIYVSSIHRIGFCLVECCNFLQHQGLVRVDQKLKDLFMQVFDILKESIAQLSDPSSLTDDKAEAFMSEIEQARKSLKAHVNFLVNQPHPASEPEVAIADETGSLDDLRSLIDELSLDSPLT